jgi:RNA polymerase sigma factor (sigma-70 family)
MIDVFNDDFIKQLYTSNREKFLNYCKTYKINVGESIDIYQDAFVAFLEQYKKGKLNLVKSTPSTYLFAIGKFMLYTNLKKQKKLVTLNNEEVFEFENFEHEISEENYYKLSTALSKMGSKCMAILQAFYYSNKKLDQITLEFKYENKDVAKSQKSRCLKQLRNFMNNG